MAPAAEGDAVVAASALAAVVVVAAGVADSQPVDVVVLEPRMPGPAAGRMALSPASATAAETA
jgi:hypothetical protein